jgi:hypothetical protein
MDFGLPEELMGALYRFPPKYPRLHSLETLAAYECRLLCLPTLD